LIRTVYTDFNQHDKFTLHAPENQVNKVVVFKERVPTYEEMRARLNLDKDNSNLIKLRPNTSVTVRKNLDYDLQEKTRKQIQEKMRGTKNLLKGVYAAMPVSNYYDNYK
jgi:hypothetical protein